MTIINIDGLSKEDVILALFKNVYGKSEEAKQTKSNIMKFTPNEPGIYSEPYNFEIYKILHRNKYIDYLGCVKFSMDFSSNIIDTNIYDEFHKPGKNGVESAKTVIDKLRRSSELKNEFKSPAKKAASPSLSNTSCSFSNSMAKSNIEKSANKTIAEEKLTALLGKSCHLMNLYLDHYVFQFSSEQSYEMLQKDAASLANKGIVVTAEAPASLCSGSVKIPAKLRFEGSLSDIVTKLSSISSIVPTATATL